MESGGSPCPVVDTTKTTNRSLGKRLCTNKQRRSRTRTYGSCGCENSGVWSLRDRSRPWRARRRRGSPLAPPRGRRAPRRPWRSRFARRRARGGGRWRTPPSPPPRPTAPCGQSSEPAPCKKPSGGQQSERVDGALQSLRPGHARSCRRCSRLVPVLSRARVPASRSGPPCSRRRLRLPCQRREEGRGSWLACPFSAHKRRLPGRPWASAQTTIHDWRRPTERCLLNIFSDPHLNLLSVFHQIFLMDSLAKPVALVESRRPAAPGVGPFQASWSCQEDKQSKPLVNNPSYTDACTSMEQIKWHAATLLPTDFVPALDVV